MLGKRKNTLMIKVIVAFLFFAIATAGFAARIAPMGTVSIIKDSNVIGEFNQEALLPEGFLLRCEAKCVIQLGDVDMEVEPKTVFSVSPMINRHYLIVKQGTVYYSLNESSRPLHFDTPTEKATTGNLHMTNSELKGYVRAVEDVTEIGVLGGGIVMLKVGSDELAIFSGEKLTISTTDSGKNAVATIEQTGLSTNTKYTFGAISSIGSSGVGSSADGGPGDGGSGGAGPGDGGSGSAGPGDGGSGGAGPGDGGSGSGGPGDGGSGGAGPGDGGSGDAGPGDGGNGDAGPGDGGSGDAGPGDGGVPAMQAPAMAVPAMQAPAMAVPAMQAPAMAVPAMQAPAVQVLAMVVPAMQAPAVQVLAMAVTVVAMVAVTAVAMAAVTVVAMAAVTAAVTVVAMAAVMAAVTAAVMAAVTAVAMAAVTVVAMAAVTAVVRDSI